MRKDELRWRGWVHCFVTRTLNDMQTSHSGITFGILYVLTKMSKCPMSCADVFVDQIVFYVRVRKVNLNKWIFNDSADY